MSFRFGAVGAFIFALALAGCASSGNGASGTEDALSPEEYEEEDLPYWMRDLAPGTPPSDNDYTRDATVYLVQAMSAGDEEAARPLLENALEEAQKGIEAAPGNPQSYFQAGEAHLGLGNIAEAAEMFDRAEEIYPRYVIETELQREEAWIEVFNEGAQLYAAGQEAEATPYFELAHRIYQGRPEAMLNLADARSRQGQLDEAADLYAQALEVMTGPRSVGMDEEVLEDWAEFIAVARFNQAQIYLRQDRHAEAVEVYEALLEHDPDNIQALSNMAAALSAMGEDERAAALYDDLMGEEGLDAADYFAMAVGLYQAENFAQAAEAFRQTWQLVPGHREALFNYSQTLYLAEDWDQLIEISDDLLGMDTHNRLAYQFVLNALSQRERTEELQTIVQQFENLEFFLQDMELGPAEGGVGLRGFAVNQSAEPGSTVDLRIHFYDLDGDEAGVADTSVQLGEPQQPAQFQVTIRTTDPVIGYRYVVR